MKSYQVALTIAVPTFLGLALFLRNDTPSGAKHPASRPLTYTHHSPAPDSVEAGVAWSGHLDPAAATRLPPQIFEAFDQWAWAAADEGDSLSSTALEEGIELAKSRRSALKQLIQHDPAAALATAIPWTLRLRLPSKITAHLEDRVSAQADYSVLAAVPQPGETLRGPAIRRSAIINGNIYHAYVYGNREAVDSKMNLPVDGIAIDDHLAIIDTPIRLRETDEPIQAAPEALISPEHMAGAPSGSDNIWISGGRAYELCCDAHAASLTAELTASESTPGPALGASGGSENYSGSGIEVGASSWTEGAKSLLVIRVDFSDLTGAPVDGSSNVIDAAYLTQRVNNEVSNWIEEVSYSKSSMTLNASDVTAVLRMPQTAATYAIGGLNDALRLDALGLATAAGFTTSNYDRVALVFKNIGTSTFPGSQITYGGLGQIGASFTWFNGNFSFGVSTHEFGHNYGLRHANRWQIPGGSNPVDPGGSSTEYGDVFDMMGSSPSDPVTNADHFNPWFLNRLDWLADSSVQTVSSSGTYRLYRYDHQNANATNTLALKLGRSTSENYWIGYRRKYVGHPSRSDVSNGAYITWGYDYQRTSNLIDIDTPGTSPNDASLNVGNTFNDSAAGIAFTVTAAGGSGISEYLDIDINFEPRISFSQTSYDIDEASGNLAVVLRRDNNTSGAVSVTLSTSDGTATSPADFTAISTVVSWADGDAAPKTVNIPIVADALTEGSEEFTLNLSGISGGVILNESSVTASIREPGAADSGFAHGFFNSSGSVRKMVVQPDGRIAFVGRASNIDNQPVNGIGRFEMDGTLDEDFSSASSSNITPVYAIARQPDGKILVAGNFTAISGVTRNRVARINDDGALDPDFDVGLGPDGVVNAIALRPDGRIVIAGNFANVAGTARRGVAQLLPNGDLDPDFLATPLSDFSAFSPECLALQADGKVLVGGLSYTSYNDALFADFSSGLLRLDEEGAIDTTFDIGSGAHISGSTNSLRRVYAIAVQPDGKVIIGGDFTAFDGVNSNRLARLGSTGAVDTDFSTAIGTGADDRIQTIEVQGDGKILVGGWFSNMSGTSRARVARLNPSGTLDSPFDAAIPLTFGGGSPNHCYQILMQPDTRILISLDEFGAGQTGVKRVFSAQSAPSGQVEFVSGSTVVNEGGAVSLAVRRTGGSLGAISISYATIPDTATTSDFVAETGFLTWADGDAADKTITINTTSDATTEPDEYFSVQLGTPIGGTSLAIAGITSVTISDLSPIEGWRLANFGSSANSGVGADDADFDSDLIANLMEYGLGRSPLLGAGDDGQAGLPTAVIDAVDPLLAGRLTLVCDLPDPTPADITYHVEVTATLESTWTLLASKSGSGPWVWQPGGIARIVESNAAGRSVVKVADVELQNAHSRRFVRLRVTRP